MKFYFTVTRKAAAAVFAAVLLLVLLAGDILAVSGIKADADTHKDRMEIIESIGVAADEDSCETKSITIPLEFSDVYKEYNSLQKKAGFDLEPYKGCKATQYTYSVKDDQQRLIHLLVYNGRLIGGDIAEISVNGKMKPLKKE